MTRFRLCTCESIREREAAESGFPRCPEEGAREDRHGVLAPYIIYTNYAADETPTQHTDVGECEARWWQYLKGNSSPSEWRPSFNKATARLRQPGKHHRSPAASGSHGAQENDAITICSQEPLSSKAVEMTTSGESPGHQRKADKVSVPKVLHHWLSSWMAAGRPRGQESSRVKEPAAPHFLGPGPHLETLETALTLPAFPSSLPPSLPLPFLPSSGIY